MESDLKLATGRCEASLSYPDKFIRRQCKNYAYVIYRGKQLCRAHFGETAPATIDKRKGIPASLLQEGGEDSRQA
jgi:hypothetical protein